MSETKFTPGPWVAEQLRRTSKWGVFSNDATGSIVTELGDFITARRPADEDAANARLIAAAPEMYEALVDAEALVVAWSAHHAMQGCTTDAEYLKASGIDGWHPTHRAIYDKLKAALAKAGRA